MRYELKQAGVFENPAPEERCRLLRQVKNIAVVGLSANPDRPSHRIARNLQAAGFRVIPVRPLLREVLGEKAYPSLSQVPDTIDLVNVFRASRYVDPIVDDCLRLKLPVLWLQDGIVNESAAIRGLAGGIQVVMDACIWRDYKGYCG